jgi:hypothetical protein
MADLLDIHGKEERIGDLATGLIANLQSKRQENVMGNAIEHVPANQSELMPSRNVMTPMEMLDRAVTSNASVETLTQLMVLQERWEANQARKAFDSAMADAKASMPSIAKTKKVDFTTAKGRTNYQYEDLASIMNQIGPVLSRNGLSVRYRTQAEPNMPISVTCIISHRMGHSEENTLMAGRDDSGNKNSIQAIGSTVTYLQRYTLKAALGLAASADDDGAKSEDTGAITEGEREIILTMVEETGADIEKFCEVLQIDSVATMPAAKFRRAVALLEAKKRKVASNG